MPRPYLVRSDFKVQYVTIVRSDKLAIFDAKMRSDFKVQYVTIVRSDKSDKFELGGGCEYINGVIKCYGGGGLVSCKNNLIILKINGDLLVLLKILMIIRCDR